MNKYTPNPLLVHILDEEDLGESPLSIEELDKKARGLPGFRGLTKRNGRVYIDGGTIAQKKRIKKALMG